MTQDPSSPARARVEITPELIRRAAGDELRRLRLRAGMTQAELETVTGIARPILCRAERGVHTMTLETCTRIAEGCGGGLGHVLLAVDRAIGALP